MNTARKPLASAAVVLPAAMAIVPSVAHATPYAFADNQITGLTITGLGGTPLSVVGTPTTTVSDNAQFSGFTSSSNVANGTVGSALSIPQAYAGPGPAPSGGFGPVGPGNFTGTRSNAMITAGSASTGGVGVSNVAEGFGNATGSSTAFNTATINFTVVGTGQAVVLSGTDAFMLAASTAANVGENANAGITNTFTVTQAGATTPHDRFAPGALQASVASLAGGSSPSVSGSQSLAFTTSPLTAGTTYTISLLSQSTESIVPGTGVTPVPEPASIAILGAGLLGLGLTFRRKRG